MIFGEVPSEEAAGAVLAHGVAADGFTLRKGRMLGPQDVAALMAAGARTVIVVRLETGDVAEDEAAQAIAAAAAGDGIGVGHSANGRANLHADAHGILSIQVDRVHAANAVDGAITLATLPEFVVVRPRQMLATVKIIPFSAPRAAVEECRSKLSTPTPAIRVAPFRPHRAGLVLTRLPGTKPSALVKTTEVTRRRLAAFGSTIEDSAVVTHDVVAVAAAIRAQHADGLDPILIAGASATVDRRDVVPAAVEVAGGRVLHFGMPVDPGNLLLLARMGGTAVIGLPGCARSPKLNGFDWVLQRLLAGLEIRAADITRLGVGGLLNEIPTRPQPREEAL